VLGPLTVSVLQIEGSWKEGDVGDPRKGTHGLGALVLAVAGSESSADRTEKTQNGR